MEHTKRIIVFKVLVLFQVYIISGCSKTEYVEVDVSPQLEILVSDVDGNPIQDATVSLFRTKNDWETNNNIVQSKTTDASGEVLFKELEEKIYYFFVEKSQFSNLYEVASFEEPLGKNQKKIITCTIR